MYGWKSSNPVLPANTKPIPILTARLATTSTSIERLGAPAFETLWPASSAHPMQLV